jgi:hypothetical protein
MSKCIFCGATRDGDRTCANCGSSPSQEKIYKGGGVSAILKFFAVVMVVSSIIVGLFFLFVVADLDDSFFKSFWIGVAIELIVGGIFTASLIFALAMIVDYLRFIAAQLDKAPPIEIKAEARLQPQPLPEVPNHDGSYYDSNTGRMVRPGNQ